MPGQLIWLVTSVALPWLLTSCEGVEILDEASCQSGDDCPARSVCVSGYCVEGGDAAAVGCSDEDGDGFYASKGCGSEVDCNDTNPQIYPGAEERCDEKDNDCDGEIDDLPGPTAEGQHSASSCGKCATDCTDLFPHATAGCKKGKCVPESCEKHYFDVNGEASDGCEYRCKSSEKKGSVASDDATCDELDDDCDGKTDEDVSGLGEACTVGNGPCKTDGTYVCATVGIRCDGTPDMSKSEKEVCDGKDNDCNGKVDDDPTDGKTWYRDDDGDSYGDPNETKSTCMNRGRPSGYVANSDDCDDTSAKRNPDVVEDKCNGKDDDCDGKWDEDTHRIRHTYYRDSDGDGYGDRTVTRRACKPPGMKWERDYDDCDDSDPQIHPRGTERCNGKDDDCDGRTDEYVEKVCGIDTGDCRTGTKACNQGTWGACVGGKKPDMETCDGRDNDCDGQTDEKLVKKCIKQDGVCKGAEKKCSPTGLYDACGSSEFGPEYEAVESSCQDGKDNDCDGLTDCKDSNCTTDPKCGN